MPFALVIHGHFYQPPRENPFLDVVEVEESAAPFHDWNQRIERECYRAVVAARLTARDGRIRGVVNTLEWISFNVGPTLLEWMEHAAHDTYSAILEADRASAVRLGGHGNAIAQPYHHTILPLASRRDKRTEVRWGIADFRRRFGREPEGMWLPETAVDDETLDVLAEEGVRFTIVAPHQVKVLPAGGRPGQYRTSQGRTIALCAYHGDLSHGIAFGGLLHDADRWVEAMMSLGAGLGAPGPAIDASASAVPPARARERHGAHHTVADPVLSAATDGETYGHHHRFGEMALARALEQVRDVGVRVENFGSVLARAGALEAVDLVEPTAWSCPHGVGRWKEDCGCRIDGARYPSQAWRAPLRAGLERLALDLHAVYEREGARLLSDPWSVRDGYGAVITAPRGDVERFIRAAATGTTDESLVRARELLEMERDALRMFTSCAWFFDDIGGLEPRQVLRYAARAIALAGPEGAALEARLLEALAQASSNDVAKGTGRDIFLTTARQRMPAPVRIAAAAAATRHVGAAGRERFTTAELDVDGERIRVADRRTGRRFAFTARVEQPHATDIVVELVDERGLTWRLGVADLPERPRLAIRSVLRRTILPRCLSPEELDLLVTGDVTLGGLLRVALIRSIERLAVDTTTASEQLVNDLLDVFEQSEAQIPFDAQSAFWRAWTSADSAKRRSLRPFIRRLGFALELAETE